MNSLLGRQHMAEGADAVCGSSVKRRRLSRHKTKNPLSLLSHAGLLGLQSRSANLICKFGLKLWV